MKYKLRLGIIMVFLVVRQLLLVLAQELNARVFDKLVIRSFNAFIIAIILSVIVWIAITSLDATLNVGKGKVELDISQSIREDISNKMIKTSYKEFHNKSMGNYLSWLNNDISNISQKGVKQYFELISDISGVIFASVALLKYSWTLLLITLIGFVCMFYTPKLFNKRISEISHKVTMANEEFVSNVEDELNGYQVYFAFSSLGQFVNKVKYLSKALNKVLIKDIRLDAAIIAVNFSVNVFFQILLTFIGGILYFKGNMTLGAVSIVGGLADIIFTGLGSVSYRISSIKSTIPIFNKFETLKAEEVNESILEDKLIYEANNISLKYGDDKIFNDLSFKLNEGDKCLISGISGSGKSSLLKLLTGYNYEYEGILKYRGNDIKKISSKIIAREVYYLSQKTHVFNTTVEENIKLGNEYSTEEMLNVLGVVGLKTTEELLKSDAKKLSGGQVQRLALARALIRKPRVIICDEITSALDKESGQMIENILLNNKELTVIMITHSLHSEYDKFSKVISL